MAGLPGPSQVPPKLVSGCSCDLKEPGLVQAAQKQQDTNAKCCRPIKSCIDRGDASLGQIAEVGRFPRGEQTAPTWLLSFRKARLHVSMWDDGEFCRVRAEAQRRTRNLAPTPYGPSMTPQGCAPDL